MSYHNTSFFHLFYVYFNYFLSLSLCIKVNKRIIMIFYKWFYNLFQCFNYPSFGAIIVYQWCPTFSQRLCLILSSKKCNCKRFSTSRSASLSPCSMPPGTSCFAFLAKRKTESEYRFFVARSEVWFSVLLYFSFIFDSWSQDRFVAVRKRKPRTQPLVHKEPQNDRGVNSEQEDAPQMVIPCVQPERPATTNVESFISVRDSVNIVYSVHYFPCGIYKFPR